MRGGAIGIGALYQPPAGACARRVKCPIATDPEGRAAAHERSSTGGA
jgi:hypothetical protein